MASSNDDLLDLIINAHRATVEIIQTLSCDIEVESKFHPNKQLITKTFKGRYVRSGNNIHIQMQEGEVSRDVFLKDSILNTITRNPSRKSRTTSATKTTYKGGPLTDCDVWQHAFLVLNVPETGDLVPFERLLKLCSTVERTEWATFADRKLAGVHLRFDVAGQRRHEWRMVIYFDPTLNYLIRKITYQTAPSSKLHIEREYEIVSAKPLSSTLFFPERSEGRSMKSGVLQASTIASFANISINETVPPEVFDFDYPQGVELFDAINRVAYKVDKEGNQISAGTRFANKPPPPTAYSIGIVGNQPKGATQQEGTSNNRWLVIGSLCIIVFGLGGAVLRRWWRQRA